MVKCHQFKQQIQLAVIFCLILSHRRGTRVLLAQQKEQQIVQRSFPVPGAAPGAGISHSCSQFSPGAPLRFIGLLLSMFTFDKNVSLAPCSDPQILADGDGKRESGLKIKEEEWMETSSFQRCGKIGNYRIREWFGSSPSSTPLAGTPLTIPNPIQPALCEGK